MDKIEYSSSSESSDSGQAKVTLGKRTRRDSHSSESDEDLMAIALKNQKIALAHKVTKKETEAKVPAQRLDLSQLKDEQAKAFFAQLPPPSKGPSVASAIQTGSLVTI